MFFFNLICVCLAVCFHRLCQRWGWQKNLRKQPTFKYKRNENGYHTNVQIHAQKHTTRYGVLSLCGPVLGCGVKQEMCEPWRHVFMLAAVAHHQPEGKQTPAPLRLRSIFSPPPPPNPSAWSSLTFGSARAYRSHTGFFLLFPVSPFIFSCHRRKVSCKPQNNQLNSLHIKIKG